MAETILNRRIVMASRPTGMPTLENFRMEEVEEPREAPEGGVLLKTLFFSLDPYMRGRMDAGPSYAQALEPGGVMEGGSVCEVLASRDAAFKPGDIVLASTGWQTHPRVSAKGLRKIDPALAPVLAMLWRFAGEIDNYVAQCDAKKIYHGLAGRRWQIGEKIAYKCFSFDGGHFPS